MENEDRKIKIDSKIITYREKSFFCEDIYHHKTIIENGCIGGHGTSINKNISIEKSINEFIERAYLHEVGFERFQKNSNGFACNSVQSFALQSAKNELIERSIFLTHWFQEIPPVWLSFVDICTLLDNSNYVELLKKVQKSSFELHIGMLSQYEDRNTIIALVRHKKLTGYAVATATDSSIGIAITKCIDDSIRVIDLLLSRIKSGEALFNPLHSSQVNNPSDHLEYYLNPENWSKHDWIFVKNDSLRKYVAVDIKVEIVSEVSMGAYKACVAYAKSNNLQNLFFGETRDHFLNDDNKSNIKNSCIHPLA